ncbi:hypothetical protein C0J52_10316 [Blattella germanica]|nr:hypothetical protein C0J52_10316 [Blattella germanica]
MKLCWHSLPERPLLLQVHSMLNHLHSSRERYSQDGDNSSLKTDEDFERRWEMFKPNTIPKTDNHITSSETTPVVQSPTHSTADSPMRNPPSDVTGARLESVDESLRPRSLILQPAAFESMVSSRDSGNLTVDGSSTTPLTTSPQPSLASSSGGEFFIPSLQHRHKSPSLQNLRGSIDDLSEVANVPVWQKTGESDDVDHTSDIVEKKEGEAGPLDEIKEKESEEVISLEPDFDSWLKGVETTNEEDAKFVRKISEAIRDLDNALALEKTSSSSSSEASSKSVSHQSPVKDTATVLSEQNVVLDFRLGRADSGVSSDDKEMMFQPDSLQDDSFIEHAKSVHIENRATDSGTDTEDETWRKRIERGEFSEKVKEKSKSVADLMVLTHIECSDGSDSDTPSLTWCFERSSNGRSSFTTKLRPGSVNKNSAVVCSSESNIHEAVLGEEFKDTLKKLHEAQRENKTLKQEPLLLNPLSEDSHSSNHEKEENFLANDASEEFTMQEGEGVARSNREVLTKYAITEKSLQSNNVAGSSDVAQVDAFMKDTQSSSSQVPEEDSACSSASISDSQDVKDCNSKDIVSVLASVDSSMSEVLDDNVPHLHVIESSLHSVVKDISSDNCDLTSVSLLESDNLSKSEMSEDSSVVTASKPLFTSTPHISQYKEEDNEPVHRSAIRRLDYCETMPTSSVSSLSPSRTYSSDASVEPLETSYNDSVSSSYVLSDSFQFSPADKNVNKLENLHELSPETSAKFSSSSQENVPLASAETNVPAPFNEVDRKECLESVASNVIPSVVLGPCEEYTLDYFKGLKTTSGGESENIDLTHSEDISYLGKDVYHGEVPEENQPKPMLDYCITSWEKHLSSSFKEHEPEVSLFDIGFNSGADSLLDKEQLANDKHRSTDTPDANIDQDSLNLEHGVTDDINLSNLSVDDEFLEDSSQKIFQHDSNSMFEDVFELLENPQKGLENETIASTNKKNIELDLGQEITNFSPIMHSTSAVQETGMLKSERNDRVLTADILPEVNEKLMTPGLCIPSLNFIAATPIPSGRNTPEMYEEESAPTPDLSQITDTWNENFPEENLPDGCKDNLKNVDYNNESKVSATNEEPSVTVNEELALTNTMGPDLEILPNVSFCAGKNYEAHSDLELDDVLVNLEENTPGAGIGVTLENVDTPMNVSEIQSSLDASEKVNDLIGTLKEIPDLDKIVEKVNSETDKICMESEHTNTSSSVNSLYDMKENSEITLSNKIEDIPLEETISSSDIVVKTADSFEIPTSIDKSMNVSISEMSGERITNFASSPKETEKEGNSTDIFPVLDNSGITSNDVKSDVKEEMQNGVNVNNEPIMTEMVATTNNAGIVLSNSLNESENLNVNTQQNTVETNNNEYISDPLDKTRVVVGSEIVHESSSKELTSIEMPLVDVETISSNNITHVTDTEGFINSTEITHKPNNLPALSDEVQEESKMEKVVYGVSDKLENNDSLHELTEIVSNDNVNAKGSCLLIDKHLGIEDFSVVDNMDTNNVKDNLGESSSDTAMNNNLIGTSETFHIVSNEVSSTDLENTHLFEIQSKAPSVLNDSKKSIPSQSLKCNQLPEYEESNTSQKYIVQNVLSPESIICKTQDFLDNEKNIKSVNMLSDRSHIEKELSALKETNTSLINCHNLNVLDEEDRNTNSVEEIACKRKISKEDNLLSSIELCDPLYMKHSRHFVGDDGGIWLAHSKCEPYQKLDTNIKMEGVMDSNITLSPDSLKIHNEGMLKRESKYINDDLTNMNTKEISEKQSLPDVSIELQKDKLEDAFALSAVKSYDLPLEIVGPKLQENETSALNPLNELVTEEPIEIKFSNYSDLALIPDTKINNDNSSMDFFNCDQDTLGPNKGMHFNTNAVGDSQENKMSPNSDNLSYEQMSVDVDMKHPMDVFNEKEANRVSTVIDSWKQKQFDSNSRTLMEDFLLGERLASGLSASALEIKTEELPETYETAGDAEDDSEDFGLDAVKHSTPDDERSSDSGFRDKGSLSESCEDACDEKYNLEDIEAELEETFNKGGFTYVEKHDENEHSEHVHEDVQRKLSTKSSDDSAFNYIEKTEEEDQRRLTPGNSCDSTDNKEFFENGHNKSLLVPEDDVNAVQTMEPSKQIETFGEATLLEEAIDEEQLKQMLGITDGVKASAAFLKIECGMESHYMSPEFFQQEDLISQTFENSKPDSLNLSDDSIESVLLVQSPTDKQDRSLTKLSNISVPCESDSSLDLGTRDYNHEEIVEQVTENISEELMENHLENASLTVGTEDVEVDAEVSDNSGHISPEKSSSMLINAAKLDVTSLETFHAEDISESGVESESESRDLQREAASTPTSGWYLHPPPKSGSCDSGVNYSEEDERSNANAEDYPSPTNSGSCSSKIDDSNNSENSYVSFSLDEEFVTAIRNELREKLPCSSQQSQEEDSEEDEILDPDDELSSEDRTDIMIHYNSYPAPLSPILEERESVSSITTTVSDHYSPFASSNQRDVTKSGSDSEPVSPVFVLDSKEDSRTKYEVDAKKFEQEIREALENCSFSSSEESGSSCDKNRKAASVLFEDLEQQSTEDAQNLSVDVTVNGKNVVVVRGTNQHPEDDDLLVVNTETNEATLLESPKPKSHLAFVNSKKTILENKISVDDLSATPDFFSEDELAIGVNSDTFVIDRNRFEETFEKDCELSRRKETSSDDEVYTPDSISPEHATGTPSASSLQSPDTENLSEFFLTPSEKSPTSSDYPNSPPGPQNSAVYNPYFLHTLANNDDNPTYEKVEEIHLVANNEAEEIISELENSGIINTNNNRTEREFLSDVKTDIQEVTSSRTSSVIDDSEVTSTEESSESPEFVIKDFEENGNSVGRVKQLSAVDRLEYLTSPNLDVFAMKMDGSPESVDSQEEKENALNGNNYSRRLLLNDTLDLFKKQKEDVEEEKDWSLPNLEAAMLSTKAPMPSPEEESWKQIPSMLAFSDLNEVMARCGSGSNSCIPYGGQAEVEEGDLMSTSFSVKGDPEDQDCYTPDWESDSDETNDDDNNSSSSGEFIWKVCM